MTEAFIFEPIPVHEQKLMILAELGTWQHALDRGWLTPHAMQQLNFHLRTPDVIRAGTPAGTAVVETQTARTHLLHLLHRELVKALGMDIEYWAQHHRPEIPDDLAQLGDPS